MAKFENQYKKRMGFKVDCFVGFFQPPDKLANIESYTNE